MASTYQPGTVPDDVASLPQFLRDELLKLKTALDDSQSVIRKQVLTVEPAKSQDGDEGEFAAGVVGVSAGTYIKRSGFWVFTG